MRRGFSTFRQVQWAPLWRSYRGEGRSLAIYTLGAVLMSAAALPNLLLLRAAFDTAIPGRRVQLLIEIGLALVLLRAATSLLALSLRSYMVLSVRGATARLRNELVAALQARSHAAMADRDTARLHSQIVFDTERVDNMADAVLSGALPAAVTSLLLLGALLWLNPWLVLLATLFLPVIWLAGRWTSRRMSGGIREFQAAFEQFGRGTRFLLDHLDLTRGLAAEAWERTRQASLVESLRAAAVRMARANAQHSHLQSNLVGLPGAFLLVVGGAAVANGSLTLGGFVIFYVAAGQLNTQFDRLSSALPAFLSGVESLAAIHQLKEAGPLEPYRGTNPHEFMGHIAIRDATFRYGDDDPPVLRDLSFHIEPGEIAAVVGANGAGKTTLIHLLMGFLRPDAGAVEADGVPYDAMDIRELRRAIGLVPQHPLLFAGTVLDNIVYGRPDATRADALEAAELASAGPLLRGLPLGIDTRVGEGGAALSGGERQLLALARAQLGRKRLLILDEPTNHLDRTTVARLMDEIANRPDRPAVLIVSHDPEVVAHATQVWSLEGGVLRQTKPRVEMEAI